MGMHQHYFYGATDQLSVQPRDILFAYVYLDPKDIPYEVMLQWNDGTWEHRAYWGANVIDWGVDGTASRRYMGPITIEGQWIRLEVPASLVELEGRMLNGMAFTLFGGRATWDRVGKYQPPAPPPPRGTLIVTVSPSPVPLDTPVQVLVSVIDSISQAPVNGVIMIDDQSAGNTNTPFTYTFHIRRVRVRDPYDGKWSWELIPPVGFVRPSGYPDKSIDFGFNV
jgi:hypothetical protein